MRCACSPFAPSSFRFSDLHHARSSLTGCLAEAVFEDMFYLSESAVLVSSWGELGNNGNGPHEGGSDYVCHRDGENIPATAPAQFRGIP